MSSWWDIDFIVRGEPARVREFLANLPDEKTGFEGWRTATDSPLFHHVMVNEEGEGWAKVRASRNYHGGAAIEEMVARFPDVAFSDGGLIHLSNYEPGGEYYVWEARDGDFTQWETRITVEPDDEDVEQAIDELASKLTPGEIEHIARTVESIAAALDALNPEQRARRREKMRRFVDQMMAE